ncbi:ABC transporter permease [Thermomicrobium sp. 4228-Ro]|uniref:ABC transporter permease n=1 Tax=Thermomicrobium sp. 4228-Ro TaxID=2993937 RepID=UPI002248D344|nr:ABC transporter permease [Thermomicrobium sp. 4228-Ro]MCX2726312.1 ABC transporter permease [Thermomicrobium sp. 4228-Ro]
MATAELLDQVRPPSSATRAVIGVLTLWQRDLLRFWRDRTRIAGGLAQPLLFLAIFGAGLSPWMGRLGGATAGPDYVQFIYPGIIGMSVLFSSIFSAVSVVWDREFGFLKELLVAPIPRWSIVVGKALGGSSTSMLQGLLLLVLAPVIGVGLSLRAILVLIPLLFLLAFALSSIGLVIAARMRSTEGFGLVMNFLVTPLLFLSGALYPLNNLPSWLLVLTRLDPVTYGIDAIRRIVLASTGVPQPLIDQLGVSLFGRPLDPALDALLVLALGLVLIVVAARQFERQD